MTGVYRESRISVGPKNLRAGRSGPGTPGGPRDPFPRHEHRIPALAAKLQPRQPSPIAPKKSRGVRRDAAAVATKARQSGREVDALGNWIERPERGGDALELPQRRR